MRSAFGIEHGEFSKAYDKYGGQGKPSAGRRVSASLFGGYHPLVAGKKGKKARAWANQGSRSIGGAAAGGAAGAGIGALASKSPVGRVAGGIAGSVIGGEAGTQRGVTINQRKGYYKKEAQ